MILIMISGNDVYFECHIEANPPAYKVEWQKDVRRQWLSDLRMMMAMLVFGGGDNIGEDHNDERQIFDDDVVDHVI